MKRFALVLLVLLALAAAGAATFFFGIGYYLSPQDELVKSDAIVAVSGGETESRAQEAIAVYKAGWAPVLVFSGAAADPNGPSNAQAMATIAEREGVPRSAILMDETSTNTRENAANVKQLIDERGFKSIILVTSPYHQRRAEIAFRRMLGPTFTIINHSAVDHRWRRAHWWASGYSREITLSELQKVAYELASGQTQ
jgi:uncharacterized SAM-binding protein YcdF (DUF218 family)